MMDLQLSAEDSTCVLTAAESSHDFGVVTDTQGPLSCDFVLSNEGDVPVCILNVVSDCGCTRAKWQKSPVKPGQSVIVKATFSNDEGPTSFDKVLTVSFVGTKELLFLHLRGNVIKGLDKPGDGYQFRLGALRVGKGLYEVGHLKAGESRNGQFTLYNPWRDSVYFDVISYGEKISVEGCDKVIPPHEYSTISCGVTASDGTFGHFSETIQVRSRRAGSTRWRSGSVVLSYTVEPSSSKEISPPFAEISEEHVSLGRIPGHKVVDLYFSIANTGGSLLNVYRVEMSSGSEGLGPFALLPGQSERIRVAMDPRGAHFGKQLFTIDIYTDSARKPVHHLYVTYTVRPSLRNLFRKRSRQASICIS